MSSHNAQWGFPDESQFEVALAAQLQRVPEHQRAMVEREWRRKQAFYRAAKWRAKARKHGTQT
jgi:hypothetical protein